MNNAGGVFGERNPTEDGYEKTLQDNHLAPFLLTNLLMDELLSANAAVVTTASVAAKRYGHLDINDLNNQKKYSPNRAYGVVHFPKRPRVSTHFPPNSPSVL